MKIRASRIIPHMDTLPPTTHTDPTAYPILRPDRLTAFELYRIMEPRSLRKLAEQTGIPFGTLTVWSSNDRWTARLRTEQDQARRAIRQQADAWMIGSLPAKLKQLEDELSRIEDVYRDTGDGLVHVAKATPASVRARLLMYCVDRAIPITAPTTEDAPTEEQQVDPATLSDADLIALLKRGGRR